MNGRSQARLEWLLFVLPAAWISIGAINEFYQIAWGTGIWLGQFAPAWFAAFFFFNLFCITCLFCLMAILWQPQKFERFVTWLGVLRTRIGFLRWCTAAFLLLLPIYVLQYTFWGLVLHGPYMRIMLAFWASLIISWLFTRTGFIDWSPLLVSLVLITGLLSLFAPLARVTGYPFSLGWSEGNRLWDYSVLFRRELYIYPADQTIPVYLDIGRQFAGGIPFLIPGVNIWQVRLWLALVDVIPYLLLGWVAFRLSRKNIIPWMLAGVWAFTFVRQGPIHTPLLICAIAVALVWGRPLWLAIPVVFAAGYFAEVSRFTWLFAPGMWAAMLEFAGPLANGNGLSRDVWRRAISVGIAGVLGGYAAPMYVPVLIGLIKALGQPGGVGSGVSLSTIQTGLTSQPLLWSRLLPNETYGPGILFGLMIAIVPLIVILLHLQKFRQWPLNGWQKASVGLPLLAFLIVGLIVSVKIGGGGDLHNLDMFIIGLLFAGAIAWRSGAHEWIRHANAEPVWLRTMIIVLIVLPALKPLTQMRPLSITKDSRLVATLADITPMDPLPDPLPDTLPSQVDTEKALKNVRTAVATAAARSEVLFMDQRQLLTFSYIKDVALVPEYDKKVLIDEAMAENAAYFDGFYKDLAAQRFALIVTSPLNRRLDNEDGNFGEENNAWVKWVTKPLLCYYEPLDIMKKVDVELLVPRTGVLDCESMMP